MFDQFRVSGQALSDKITCTVGFENSFQKVALAFLGSNQQGTRQHGRYTSGTLAFCQLCSGIVGSPKEKPVAGDICTVLDESHPESERQREQRELHVPHPHRHLRRPLQDLLKVHTCQTAQHARAQGRAESYQF